MQGLRILCTAGSVTSTQPSVNTEFAQYTDHPAVTPEQKEKLFPVFVDQFTINLAPNYSVHLFDSEKHFRGRWDSSFADWRELTPGRAAPGLVAGPLPGGVWTLHILVSSAFERLQIRVQIEGTVDPAPATDPVVWHEISAAPSGDSEPRWVIGELHEHTHRSQASHSPEDAVRFYQNQGYTFLALSDYDNQPLAGLEIESALCLIPGQKIETLSGQALLLGTREFIPAYTPGGWRDLNPIIYETHEQGGLFCLVHPFALAPGREPASDRLATIDWLQVDLLEVWPGIWSERFPEILKALDLWDRLLNQGIRVFGVCGKGPNLDMTVETVERLPKMILQTEGLSEGALLTALKLGHGYMTREPAVSLWMESEFGGGIVGDEVRLPLNAPFLLYLDVSCVPQGAFMRIKTNTGVLCEMPVSSTRDTHQKFILRAQPEVTWYRAEVYRYGRPLDDLLALTNPLFVRGMMSF